MWQANFEMLPSLEFLFQAECPHDEGMCESLGVNSFRPPGAHMRQKTTIGSDNDLSPGRRQANIWTNARILLIGP